MISFETATAETTDMTAAVSKCAEKRFPDKNFRRSGRKLASVTVYSDAAPDSPTVSRVFNSDEVIFGKKSLTASAGDHGSRKTRISR
jgi:hypothetical protein